MTSKLIRTAACILRPVGTGEELSYGHLDCCRRYRARAF